MQILVSVSDADEARDAVLGGADIVDAKDPFAGPLGAVSPSALRAICAATVPVRPVSAALGDAADADALEGAARYAASTGVSVVKVGFAGRPGLATVRTIVDGAVRGVTSWAASIAASPLGSCGVFPVAYADWETTHGPSPWAIIDVAARAGASGVLIDTADKSGPGLSTLMTAAALASWVRAAHEAGLRVALAGRFRPADVPLAADAGADIIGVRGAVCEGGRTGRVSAERVRDLVRHPRVTSDSSPSWRALTCHE